MLTLIGYWTDTKHHKERWIHPKHLVDFEWEVTRRASILAYLRSGVRVGMELGYSYCRFKDGPPDSQMGCSTMTDGVWEWPEGLAIYVERYHVRLPDEFIRHMEENNFSIPVGLNANSLNNVPVDISFWKAWCKSERKKWFLKKIRNLFLNERPHEPTNSTQGANEN
jgi:hypothetical protein